MKIIDIVELCNQMAGLEIPADCFENEQIAQANDIVQKLVVCCNSVLDELYCDYATVLKSCYVVAENNYIDCTKLDLNRVVSLTDKLGNNVPYRYTTGGLFVKDGSYKLTYAILPQSVQFDSNFELPSPRITNRIFAYGVLCEYFLSDGDLEFAKLWETRYRDALHMASIKIPSAKLPVRRWI